MTGLVYKEWKQNRCFILSMILCGVVPLCFLIEKDIFNDTNILRTFGMISAFLVAGGLQTMVLRGDDRKLWGYWITSTSDGYKGFLRVKYEMVFGMVVLFMFSLQMFDELFCAVAFDTGITEIRELSNISVPLIFAQLLLRAIDIPFTLRYGNKKGSLIKLIYSLVFTIIISAMIFTNFCNFSVILFETGEKLFSGDNLSLVFGVFTVSVLVIYYLSYRISCRIYLKGVEQYDH
jgi:hypothetical protein